MASIRRNTYTTDPNLAKAVQNLSELFAPPSGADASGWANANAKRAEASRIAELYSGAAGDTDRQAVMAGIYNPTQSYKALDMNNTTTRRGQDIVANTSRFNNTADNTRALEERRMTEAGLLTRNDGDNRTKLDMNTNTVRGSTIASLYGALNPGQVRPEVPAEVAGTIGLPQITPAQGAPKTLSMDEVKAAALGQLPLEQQQGLALAGPGTQNVVRDGVPTVESNVGALGQTAYVKPDASTKPTNGQFVLANGQRGPATQGQNGRWIHAQTGEELPIDAQITNTPTPTGSNEQLGVGKAVSNDIDKQLIKTASVKDTAVRLRDIVAKSPASQGVVGSLRGTAQNVIQSGGELGQYFGGEIQRVTNGIREGAVDAKLAGLFDPNIPAIELMSNLLATQYAEMNGDRLSNELVRHTKEALGLNGLTSNQADTIARLNAAIKLIDSRQDILTKARGGGAGAVVTAAPPPPGVVAPGAATSGMLDFDADGNPL